jgi:signal transduction histidine kinase
VASPLRAGNVTYGENTSNSDEIRRVLARELHDRVAQTLTTMLIELENFKVEQTGRQSVLRQVNELQDSARGMLSNIRHVLYDLRGQNGREEAFADTVRALLVRFQERTQVKTILSISPSWPANLRSSAALNILRIIEEALTNVRLHSDATSVEVVLGGTESGRLAVEVKDDGRGTETDGGRSELGLGFLGMRERAMILGGRLEVKSVLGAGTIVRALLPLEQLI